MGFALRICGLQALHDSPPPCSPPMRNRIGGGALRVPDHVAPPPMNGSTRSFSCCAASALRKGPDGALAPPPRIHSSVTAWALCTIRRNHRISNAPAHNRLHVAHQLSERDVPGKQLLVPRPSWTRRRMHAVHAYDARARRLSHARSSPLCAPLRFYGAAANVYPCRGLAVQDGSGRVRQMCNRWRPFLGRDADSNARKYQTSTFSAGPRGTHGH